MQPADESIVMHRARAHLQVFNTTSGQPLRLAATSRQTAEVLPINATSCSGAVIAHMIDAVSAGSARRHVHRAGLQAMRMSTTSMRSARQRPDALHATSQGRLPLLLPLL